MTSAYALRSPVYFTNNAFGLSLLRDAPSEERKRSIEFHVESDDYFGTLATTLGLIADMISNNKALLAKKHLDEIRDELVYLQETHRIGHK
jgi:hypothetical protein